MQRIGNRVFVLVNGVEQGCDDVQLGIDQVRFAMLRCEIRRAAIELIRLASESGLYRQLPGEFSRW